MPSMLLYVWLQRRHIWRLYWDQIFKNRLTTATAIDRVVHHSIIIEFGREMKSVRTEEAARHNGIRLGGTSAVHDAEG